MSNAFNKVVDTRHGPMLINRHDLYLGRSLDLYGEFLRAEIDLLLGFVKPGDTVIDAGANIGDTTVPLARAVGDGGHVIAFEPQRCVFQLLCGNIALNSLANVDAYQCGLGAKEETVRIPELQMSRANNFTALSMRPPDHVYGGEGRQTRIVPIDLLDLNWVTLIKIDVEGMEEAVLQGAMDTIARCRPTLYIEAEDLAAGSRILNTLLDLDYVAYIFEAPFFDPQNYRGNPGNVFGSMASRNIIAAPKEMC